MTTINMSGRQKSCTNYKTKSISKSNATLMEAYFNVSLLHIVIIVDHMQLFLHLVGLLYSGIKKRASFPLYMNINKTSFINDFYNRHLSAGNR